MSRLAFCFTALVSIGTAQLTVVDPNLTSQLLVSGVPGVQHQVGTDVSGAIYIVEENPGGFAFGSNLHRVSPSGSQTLGFVTTGIVSAGQMVRDAASGFCHFINHWQGALEHNQIVRVEPSGSVTSLHDVLWGEGHGLAQNLAGDWFVGIPSGAFGPANVWTIPSGQLGLVTETSWSPGQGQNRFLARGESGTLLVADGPSIWRIAPNQPAVAVMTHTPSASATFAWRGLVVNPFGAGHVASLVEVPPIGPALTRVFWIGPGGPRELVQALEPAPGDGGLANDENGRLLLMVANQLWRIAPLSPSSITPGILTAPSTHSVTQPLTIALTGRIFTLSPFVFAVDLPLTAPQFPAGVLPIPPYGVVQTSLGLQASFFVVRDGFGAFGPTDPIAVIPAGGTFTESYFVPTFLSGVTLVFQAYVLDTQAPNGLLWITPPVFASFL